MITIEVDKNGIKRVLTVEGSVADAQENSDLLRVATLSLQWLHNSVVEYFSGLQDSIPELDEPKVWVPSLHDGDEVDVSRKIIFKVNVLPRRELKCVPPW